MTGTVDLGALCSLIAAAPPGPWRAVGTEVYGPSPDCLWIADTGDAGAEDGGRAVAELIAAARTALPELVTELREARREVERLRAELDTVERREDARLAAAKAEVQRLRAELDAIGDIAYRANPSAAGDALAEIHTRAKHAAKGGA